MAREEWIRRTKIVATLGPATGTMDVLTELIATGADVLRFNFSHATAEKHAERIELARQAAERVGRDVALLADLPGPKLRIGEIPGDVARAGEWPAAGAVHGRLVREREANIRFLGRASAGGAPRRRHLPGGRAHPAARQGRQAAGGRDDRGGRRHRDLTPGNEPAERRRDAARHRRGGPGLDRLRRRPRHGSAGRFLPAPARGPGAGHGAPGAAQTPTCP